MVEHLHGGRSTCSCDVNVRASLEDHSTNINIGRGVRSGNQEDLSNVGFIYNEIPYLRGAGIINWAG
jgi:hypothetical protein